MTRTGQHAALVLGGISLAVALFTGAFELFARARYDRWKEENTRRLFGDSLLIPSDDPALMWENRPSFVKKEIATNRWGFRDAEYSKEKPAGTYRIAFVGDSVTFGGGTPRPETFVARFAAGAQEPSGPGRLEAMNFSVGGYNALQLAELIRSEVLEFRPDKVVYMLCLNDFDFDDASGQLTRFFRPPRSFLWEQLTRRSPPAGVREYHEFYFDRNREQVFETLRHLKGDLARRGIAFQVVTLPVFDFSITRFRDYPLSRVHERIDHFLQDEGIAHFDLLDSFRDCGALPPSAYAIDVWHLTPLGHRFVGQALLAPALAGSPYAVVPKPEQTCTALRALRSEVGSGRERELKAALASGAPLSLAVDDGLVQLERFWPIERDARGAFAWSRDRSTVHVGHLEPLQAYRVSLHVIDSGGISQATIRVNGATPRPARSSSEELELPEPVIAGPSGEVEIELSVKTWSPSSRGSTDTRELGIAVSAVEIRAVPKSVAK